MMDGKTRKNIHSGSSVLVVKKEDQKTSRLTEGVVKDILTNSPYHGRGIKVRLENGEIGRVQIVNS
jgi:uncharacterized repeat protein (TIGR03833 family)